MKKFALLLTFLFVTRALAESPPPALTTETDVAITTLRNGLIDSFFKGDIDRVLTYLSPDVVVTWQNGEVSHGPEEVRAYYNRMMTGPNRVVSKIEANPEIEGRHVYGDWAFSWGNLHDHFVLSDGRELSLNSRFTITTAKRGDRWLVIGYHASVNPFENAILSLATHKVALWSGIAGLGIGLLLGFIASRLLKPAQASSKSE